MKVLVSVFSNLSTDQRVEKVCRSLSQNGFAVQLIGNDWGGAPEISRPYEVKRIHLRSPNLKLAYPEFNWKLYRELHAKAGGQTLLLANDLDALLPNFLISKKFGIPLIYDSHEIYTEMPALQGRFTQKIWRHLEARLIPKLSYFITANESYAQWFQQAYNIPKPVVVRNLPLRQEPINDTPNSPKIILYQGVLNPSRGLDVVIPVMAHLQNAELWLAGDGPHRKKLEVLTQNLKLEKKVKFLGKMSPEKLRILTPKADVGLSIEENSGLSYFFSLPNKISDYIQARVPVVTSNFPEMAKIVKGFGVGEVITDHSAAELVQKITLVLERGKKFYRDNLNHAAENLCWENEEFKLLEVLKKAAEENFSPE